MSDTPKTAPKTVDEVMTRKVIVLSVEDNLQDVLDAMEKFHIRHVPVVDGERLVGMVTQRDMLAMMSTRLHRSEHELAKESTFYERTFVINAMTKDPITVTPETPLREVAKILLENTFGGLPVVSQGKLVGVITETDLLRVLEQLL